MPFENICLEICLQDEDILSDDYNIRSVDIGTAAAIHCFLSVDSIHKV